MEFKSKNYEIKNYPIMTIDLVQLSRDHHAKCMMIIAFWYDFYRAPTELCRVLLRCCVGFYLLLVQNVLFSRSLEVLAKIQSL
jgi:hypothetical protein